MRELNTDDLEKLETLLDKLILKELKKSDSQMERLIFYNNIVPYQQGKDIRLECHALSSGLVIDLYGDVFPTCPHLMKSIGNVSESSLTDILAGKKAKALRNLIKSNKCPGCWNDCQMITNIELNQVFNHQEYEKLMLKYLPQIHIPSSIDVHSSIFDIIFNGLFPTELDKQEGACWTKQDFAICMPEGTRAVSLSAMMPNANSQKKPGKIEFYE